MPTTTRRPTFGQQIAVLAADLAADGQIAPPPAPATIATALRTARPRWQRPNACLTCGGPLPEAKPAYCSIPCARAAQG